MTKNYTNLIKEMKDIDPPAYLESQIFERIESAYQKKNFYRKIFGLAGLSVSILSLLSLLVYTASEFMQSNFYDYASLLFTDSKTIFNNFNEFLLSLIDSIPFWAITLTIFFLFISLIFAKYIVEKRRNLLAFKIN